MQRMNPDVILVFGTGLLQRPFIEAFPERVINLHLGLSPHYRGSGTNFWPLVNGEPEFCGATIHYLDAGVDSGPIIAHARPAIARDDGPHDIGNKAIVAGVDALAEAALAFAAAPPAGIPQTGTGRVYRRADFSASAVRRLYDNFENGMIERYLANRAVRDMRVPLIAMGEAVK